MMIATPARMVQPQPYPMPSYMYCANHGKKQPAMLRKQMVAASADAACRVYLLNT